MEKKRKRLKVIFIIFIAFYFGCSADTSRLGDDPQRNKRLVSAARSYLHQPWDWFIPPAARVFGGGDGTLKNTSGAVAWANNGLLNPDGGHETIESFNHKIYWARKEDQSSWYEYFDNPWQDAGWPGGMYEDPGINNYKAGFICYALVAQALKDAGYDIDPELIVSSDWFADQYPSVTGTAQVGDIVLYDFRRTGELPIWQHVGIITDITSGDPAHYSVVSSIGIVEHFLYGAAEKRLGIFGSAATGGDFSEWGSHLEPPVIIIVRPE